MQVGPYHLLSQVGAARDGVAYRAEAADGTPAEVRTLAPLREDGERWARLARRLRLAQLVEHSGALHLEEVCLDHDPPYVALEWAERTDLTGPLARAEAIGLVRRLAEALVCAHRQGLAHGRVAADGLYVTAGGEYKFDFTGLQVCSAAESAGDGAIAFPADVYDLGILLARLLEAAGGAGNLDALVKAMRAADPDERPTARAVAAALAEAPPEGEALGATAADRAEADEDEHERLGQTRRAERLRTTDVVGSATIAAEARPVDRLLARGRLGRYRLRDKLGQGGMGVVYRAEDEADGSVVAIKVLPADRTADPQALRRFHKEARLLAEVHNRHVANLLEVNEDGGVHYLVLEFVAGTPLDTFVNAHGPLGEPAALAILADVARGLAEAHERGIIHRDLKPANILVAELDSGQLAPKLMDFGLARHLVETESLNLTRAGAVLGTPYYMAPEQATGGAIDPRADVYSLGATLFHLLAGRPPFLASSPLEVLALHRHEPPPALQKLNPAVSDATCRLVERLLAKAPEARPANAGAVVREVERILRGEPADVALHPRLPTANADRVLCYE